MFSPEDHFLQASMRQPGFQAQLADAAVELVEASGAIGSAIWLWDDTYEALQIAAHYRLSDDYVAYGNQVSRLAVAKERAPVYQVCAGGEPQGFEQPFTEEKYTYFSAGYQDSPVRYVYALPMLHDGTSLGALSLYYDRILQPTELQLLWLRAVVRRLCAVVAGHRQERRLDAQIQELEESNTFLQGLVADLENQDRMKRHMLGQVNHDLRTPLTAIKGFADLMRLELGDAITPSVLASIEHIHRNVDRLVRMSDGMLEVVRLEEGAFAIAPRRTDLAKLIRDVVADLAPLAQAKHLTLETTTVPCLEISLDPRRIEHALANLLGNAVKFTQQGGRIEVRLMARPDGARVEVCDNGAGIPPELQPRLFEKFYQVGSEADKHRTGSGLGLWIVKNIVEAHSGRVGVESAVDQGSIFWFELPERTLPEIARIGSLSAEQAQV